MYRVWAWNLSCDSNVKSPCMCNIAARVDNSSHVEATSYLITNRGSLVESSVFWNLHLLFSITVEYGLEAVYTA